MRITFFLLTFASLVMMTMRPSDAGDQGYGQNCAQKHTCTTCVEKHIYVAAPPSKGEEPGQESGDLNRPEGGFAAPPRTGTMAGASNSIGIEGFAIELPALKLEFPKIRFPSLTHYRRNPQMIIDEAKAPFVSDFRDEFSVGAPESPQTESGTLERPNQESGEIQKGQLKAPPLPDAVQRHVSQRDAHNQEIHRLEQAERRLEERMLQLQHSMAQMANSMQQMQQMALESRSQLAPASNTLSFARSEPRLLTAVEVPQTTEVRQSSFVGGHGQPRHLPSLPALRRLPATP